MTHTQRDAALRQMLHDRRMELQDDIRKHLHQGRSDRPAEGRDDLELSDDHIRGDLSFALLQMKSETIKQLEAAIARIDEGTYGKCVACERPIASRRLRALPFAVRCQPCASGREQAVLGDPLAARWSPLSGALGHDAG